VSSKIGQIELLIRGSLVQAHPEAQKKGSCRSMTYRTFLFLTFQICTHFASNFERCTQPAPTTLLNSLKRFCKR